MTVLPDLVLETVELDGAAGALGGDLGDAGVCCGGCAGVVGGVLTVGSDGVGASVDVDGEVLLGLPPGCAAGMVCADFLALRWRRFLLKTFPLVSSTT